jgi:hypothetical protein
VIFHSYVSLPEGIVNDHKIWPQMVRYFHKMDPKIPIDIVVSCRFSLKPIH